MTLDTELWVSVFRFWFFPLGTFNILLHSCLYHFWGKVECNFHLCFSRQGDFSHMAPFRIFLYICFYLVWECVQVQFRLFVSFYYICPAWYSLSYLDLCFDVQVYLGVILWLLFKYFFWNSHYTYDSTFVVVSQFLDILGFYSAFLSFFLFVRSFFLVSTEIASILEILSSAMFSVPVSPTKAFFIFLSDIIFLLVCLVIFS